MTVTARSLARGHEISWDGVRWVYEDGTPADVERPCVKCGRTATPGSPDPCLGTLPDVTAACCGHGVAEPYTLPTARTTALADGEWP